MPQRGPMRITWGANYANSLYVPYFDNAASYTEPPEEFEAVRAPSGYMAAWAPDEVPHLVGDVRWIPTTDTTDPTLMSGWDGATGWRAALAWMRQYGENRPRVHTDARNLYRFPLMTVDSNADGVVDGHAIYRSLSGTSYSLVNGYQRITAAFTGANQLAGVEALNSIPAWPAMPKRAYSFDARVTRASGATTGSLTFVVRREFRDAAGAATAAAAFLLIATDPSNTVTWARFTIEDSVVPPAGTAQINLRPCLRSAIDGTATGSALELRDIQVELGGFSTFVNSDAYVESYLLEPQKGEPALERDATRTLRVRFSSYSGATYDGF